LHPERFGYFTLKTKNNYLIVKVLFKCPIKKQIYLQKIASFAIVLLLGEKSGKRFGRKLNIAVIDVEIIKLLKKTIEWLIIFLDKRINCFPPLFAKRLFCLRKHNIIYIMAVNFSLSITGNS